MILTHQTCQHRYGPLDNRPVTVARRCVRCSQKEYWRADLGMWVDSHGEPCSADPGGTEPPKAA